MRFLRKIAESGAKRADELQTNRIRAISWSGLRGKFLEHRVRPPHLTQQPREPPTPPRHGETSIQALLRGHDVGVHVLMHHRQRSIAQLGIDVCDGVRRDDD